MKLRRCPKPRPQSDRWAAFDSLPQLARQALAQAAYPLDPLKLVGVGDAEEALRRIDQLDAAARRRADRAA